MQQAGAARRKALIHRKVLSRGDVKRQEPAIKAQLAKQRTKPTSALQRDEAAASTKLKKPIQASVIPDSFKKADVLRKARVPNSKAAAGRVLDIVARPTYAVMSNLDESIKRGAIIPTGEDKKAIRQATKEGLQGKRKTLGSNVLKTAGVDNKYVRGIGGFALDVALTPGPRLGLKAPARLGGKAAAKKAAQKVTVGEIQHARKLSPSTAKQAGEEAKAAVKKAEQKSGKPLAPREKGRIARKAQARVVHAPEGTRGVSVRLAGKEVPGIGKATRAVADAPYVAGARRHIRENEARRNVGAAINASHRPAGVTRAENKAAHQATIAARARAESILQDAAERAESYARDTGAKQTIRQKLSRKKEWTEDQKKKVRTAAETGDHSKLSPGERKVAEKIRGHQAADLAEGQKSGVIQAKLGVREAGDAKEHFPRMWYESELDPATAPRKGTRAYGNAKERKRRAIVDEAGYKDKPSHDIPRVMGDSRRKQAAATSQSVLEEGLQKLGRKHTQHAKRGADDAVYTVSRDPGKGTRLVEVTDRADIQRLASKGGGLILNRKLVETARTHLTPPKATHPGIAKNIGRWKALKTIYSPSYWTRNKASDITQGFEAGTTSHPGSYLSASGVQQRRAERNKIARTGKGSRLPEPMAKGGSIRTPNGKITYDEFIDEVEKRGGFGSGMTEREITQQLEAGGKPRKRGPVRRFAQRLETGPRVSTGISALKDAKKGTSRKEMFDDAVERMSDAHYDYGKVTPIVRSLRETGVAPFGTFASKNIPRQAKRLVQRPGRLGKLEVARQELAEAAGLPDDWQEQLPDYQKRELPIPLPGKRMKDEHGNQLMANMGLAVNDLNWLSADKGSTGQRIAGLIGPVKLAAEYGANHSYYTGRDLPEWQQLTDATGDKAKGGEKTIDGRTLKAGDKLPGGTTKRLWIAGAPGPRVTYIENKRRRAGDPKMVWAVSGNDWNAFTTLAPAAVAKGVDALRTGKNERGQTRGMKVSGIVGGRVTPYSPTENKIADKFIEWEKIKKKTEQAGIGKKANNRGLANLQRQQSKIEGEIAQLTKSRGDKNPVFGNKLPENPVKKEIRKIKQEAGMSPEMRQRQIQKEVREDIARFKKEQKAMRL